MLAEAPGGGGTAGKSKKIRVDLDLAARDNDGDSLPDFVERAVRVDPANADTDRDGLKDGEDLTPNGFRRRAGVQEFQSFRTFAPRMRRCLISRRAVLAASRGKACTSVRMGMAAARARKSSASARVTLATLLIDFSSQR